MLQFHIALYEKCIPLGSVGIRARAPIGVDVTVCEEEEEDHSTIRVVEHDARYQRILKVDHDGNAALYIPTLLLHSWLKSFSCHLH